MREEDLKNENSKIPSNGNSSGGHLTGRRIRVSLVVGLVIVSTLFVVSYGLILSRPSNVPFDQQNNAFPKVAHIYDPSIDSTRENKLQLVDVLNQKIDSATSEYSRLKYILEKATILVVPRVKSPTREMQSESRKLFTEVYEATKMSSNEDYMLLKEIALYGYVFSFVETGFSTNAIPDMSEDIRNTYFSYFNTDESRTDDTNKRQREALKGMVSLLDDTDVFVLLRDDKIFNGYSIGVKATYLDSYHNEMTPEESWGLIASMRNDISEFNNGKIVIADARNIRLTMISPKNIAFANYVMNLVEKKSTDYSELEKVSSEIQILPEDEFGKSIILSMLYIDLIGILGRANSPEEKVEENVDRIELLIQNNPNIVPILQGRLNYRLSKNGKWLDIMNDFFEVSKKSASLRALLSQVGVQGYQN